MFGKKVRKEMVEVKVRNIEEGLEEIVITDKKGLNGLVINGYDILEVKKIKA